MNGGCVTAPQNDAGRGPVWRADAEHGVITEKARTSANVKMGNFELAQVIAV